MGPFTPLSFVLRWLVALFGVFATYNPSGYSYYHWLRRDPAIGSPQALAGIALVIFYIVYLRATVRSLGPVGMGLASALLGATAWLLAHWRVVDLDQPDQRMVVSLSITASLLAIGMSWSSIRYTISGQYDSEDVGTGPPI
jgi:Family of unknown function (DUF6524)